MLFYLGSSSHSPHLTINIVEYAEKLQSANKVETLRYCQGECQKCAYMCEDVSRKTDDLLGSDFGSSTSAHNDLGSEGGPGTVR